MAVARAALANQNTHVEQIQAFTEVGTRPEIDLLQARSDQANSEVQLINAENDYATGRALLNQAMGVEAPAAYDVIGDAASRCPVRQARSSRWSTRRSAPARFGGPGLPAPRPGTHEQGNDGPLLPGALRRHRAYLRRRQLGHLVWNWSGGLTLSWAILEGGLVRATQREGAAQADAVRAQIDILRQQVRVDVDAARLAIAAGKAALSAAERSVANARARLDLAEVRYQTGVGNGIELSDAQLAATNAEFLRLQATLKLDTARAQLARALGRR